MKPVKTPEGIDIVEFLKARSHEVKSIENSISVSHKQSLVWQRLPYYKRRRNRNFDKRSSKKFSFRPKDRHVLRTHTYYAKRFFMLKLPNFSIPFKRRVKSMKYIYKSQHRGFVFDESFRGVWTYNIADFTKYIEDEQINGDDIDIHRKIVKSVDFNKGPVIQYVDNQFEIIIGNDRVTVVGIELSIPKCTTTKEDCCISVLSHMDDLVFRNSGGYRIYKADRVNLETHKIVCKRSEVMTLFQALINASLIPICLDEIHRLALEKNTWSIYDNVNSSMFGTVENRLVEDIVKKHGRTPPAKRVNYDLERLYIHKEKAGRYFTFIIPKGTVESAAEIFLGDRCIGRVVRGGYRFSIARFCGLGFCYNDFTAEIDEIVCRSIKGGDCRLMKFVSWL